ncbi:hypothetical protein WAF17_16730 [Bernardetia sp. ABR2-2B]|uniref:hypothetical protein n=1 Tax=Bernardetia sp. ABR2-2B TaxID=3127472 RepID=UPI0030CD542D
MITVTTTRTNVAHNTYVEKTIYKIFGLTFLKTFHNVIVNDKHFTIQGLIDFLNKKWQEEANQ